MLLKSVRVGTAQPISGEIRNAGDADLILLLMHEDGAVRDVSNAPVRPP